MGDLFDRPRRPPLRHTSADGTGRASQTGGGVLSREADEVVDAFLRLNTDEARAAFADQWLGRAGAALDRTWVMVYELGRLVRDKRLYAEPKAKTALVAGEYRPIAERKTFDTFEAYWTAKLGKPFVTWAELERTYHFAATAAPELFNGTLAGAHEARQRVLATAPDPRPSGGQKGNTNNRGKPRSESSVAITTLDSGGPRSQPKRDAEYWLGRLKAEAPEYAEAWVRGEFQGVHGACVAAGLKPPADPVKKVLGLVRRMDAAQRARLWAELQALLAPDGGAP